MKRERDIRIIPKLSGVKTAFRCTPALINFLNNYFLLYTMDAIDFEALSEQLAKIEAAALQDLLQLLPENVPAVQKIVQNALD